MEYASTQRIHRQHACETRRYHVGAPALRIDHRETTTPAPLPHSRCCVVPLTGEGLTTDVVDIFPAAAASDLAALVGDMADTHLLRCHVGVS